MSDSPYVPINCSYYDELEALATLKQAVEIVFRGPDGNSTQTTHGVILTFYIEAGVEYLRMKDGLAIRLDHLVQVDGKPARLVC